MSAWRQDNGAGLEPNQPWYVDEVVELPLARAEERLKPSSCRMAATENKYAAAAAFFSLRRRRQQQLKEYQFPLLSLFSLPKKHHHSRPDVDASVAALIGDGFADAPPRATSAPPHLEQLWAAQGVRAVFFFSFSSAEFFFVCFVSLLFAMSRRSFEHCLLELVLLFLFPSLNLSPAASRSARGPDP